MIDPLVFERLKASGETDFFVWMTEQAEFAQATRLPHKAG